MKCLLGSQLGDAAFHPLNLLLGMQDVPFSKIDTPELDSEERSLGDQPRDL